MSGLALVAAQLGADVTGSDRAESSYLAELRAVGIEPAIGHDAANVPDGAELVYSTAIPEDNPERAAARERGLAQLHRGELLGEVSALKRCLAVSGTHGKTTTTAMIVHALRACGMDPAFLVGGEIQVGDGPPRNAAWGTGEWIVVEGDESDRSLLQLGPEIAVRHQRRARPPRHLRLAPRPRRHAARVPRRGRAGGGLGPAGAARAARRPGGRVRRGGPRARRRTGPASPSRAWTCACRCPAPTTRSTRPPRWPPARWRAPTRGGPPRRWPTSAASGAASSASARPPRAPSSTTTTPTTRPRSRRRCGRRARWRRGGWSPSSSRTSTRARPPCGGSSGPRSRWPTSRVVVEIYPARERADDFPGVTGLLVAQAAADAAGGRRVLWLPGLDERRARAARGARDGDLCLVLGAGDIDRLGRRLVAAPT